MAEVAIPGQNSAHELATGLLIRGIKINGQYGIVTNCTINPVQDIDEVYYIQAGPRPFIGDFAGNKHIEGEITLPVRIDKDGTLDPILVELLDNAQNPDTALIIETNHLLADLDITANNGGTDNNELLTLDCCLVQNLTFTASSTEGVKVQAKIVGMYDARSESELIVPPEGYLLHRQLSFADCDISRYESDMRTVSQFQIQIQNEIEMPMFLMTLDEVAHDQPGFIGITSCKWTGFFEEVLRRGVEQETYIHGGFMVDQNLRLNFGSLVAKIDVPMFKIAEQPFDSKYLKRKTEFFAQILPNLRNSAGDLFIFP